MQNSAIIRQDTGIIELNGFDLLPDGSDVTLMILGGNRKKIVIRKGKDDPFVNKVSTRLDGRDLLDYGSIKMFEECRGTEYKIEFVEIQGEYIQL